MRTYHDTQLNDRTRVGCKSPLTGGVKGANAGGTISFDARGRDALRPEEAFNRQAGFTEKGDELPAFFYTVAPPPTNNVARFHGPGVHKMYERLPA